MLKNMNSLTGPELRQLLLDQWGQSYDVQLRRSGDRVALLVMWKYLGQASFPMNEADYMAHLDEISALVTDWGQAEVVRQEIMASRQRPRMGKAISIPLELSHLGDRATEWIL